MAIRFGKEYELLIGRATPLKDKIIPKVGGARLISKGTNSVGVPAQDFNSVPANFMVFRDFQITAKIGQTKDQSPVNEITITNISDDSIKRIKKDDTIILRAGYRQTSGDYLQNQSLIEDDQQPNIMVGQVIRVSTAFSGSDKVTSILCGDSVTTKKNSKISKSYGPDTRRLAVLRDLLDLAKTQGVPIGSIRLPEEGSNGLAIINSSFLSGYTAKGNLFDEIDRFCASLEMRAYTALGKLYVEPLKTVSIKDTLLKVSTDSSNTTIVKTPLSKSAVIFTVTPENVKNTIQPMDDNSGTASNANDGVDKTSLKLTTYLDGRISTDRVMRLRGFSELEYNGDYEITSVIHNLDFRGNAWDTEVTLRKL